MAADAQLQSTSDGRGGFACPFHGRRVHRGDGVEPGDPTGCGLGLDDTGWGQVQTRCPSGQGRSGGWRLAVADQEDERGSTGLGHRVGQRSLRLVDSPDPIERRRLLIALEAEVTDCRACDRLVEWREQIGRDKRAAFRDQDYWAKAVPGFGDPDAHLLVVGLAPAAHGANRTGRVFTGDRSGDFLFRALWRAGYANQPEAVDRSDGLVLDGAWITAPVKCAPPQNKPTTVERDTCRPFFERELAALAGVRVIVALGQFGYQVVARELGIRPRPRFGHGVEVPIDPDRTLLCSYHVSQQNTFTGRLTEDMLDAVFRRARQLGVARTT